MSHEQYVQYCRDSDYEEWQYDGVQYPHPYLLMWFECRRYANPLTGVPALYDSTRGPEGQDAELTLAFEVLEEGYSRHEAEEQRRKELYERRKEMLLGQ